MADVLFGDMDVEYAATIADSAIRSMAKQLVPATQNISKHLPNQTLRASQACTTNPVRA